MIAYCIPAEVLAKTLIYTRVPTRLGAPFFLWSDAGPAPKPPNPRPNPPSARPPKISNVNTLRVREARDGKGASARHAFWPERNSPLAKRF